VAVIRRERPHVIVTYSDDQRGYQHPDHLRVHDITVPAFDRAADPEWYPDAGDPWQPLKLYYSTWSRARMVAMHEKFLELGLESPYAERFLSSDRPDQDHRITTQVPIDGYQDARTEGLLAHATQVDPTSPFWFGLPRDVANSVHPYDDYILARSLVDTEVPESDLFAGIDGFDWEGHGERRAVHRLVCTGRANAWPTCRPGPGGSGVVALVVSGGDPGRVTATWVIEDGRPTSVDLDSGQDARGRRPAVAGDAEAMVLAGDLDPAAAYMRGDLKPEGSSRAWFAWLSALARDDVRRALVS
jgi:hypothetical protein